MAPEGMDAISWAPNHAILLVFFALFVTYFVHNVAATLSYDIKELLYIRTRSLTLNWTNNFSLMSRTRGIYSRHPTRPSSLSIAGEKDGDIAEGDQGAL